MKKKFINSVDSELPVLVNFYATWCTSCKFLVPILQQVLTEMGNNLELIEIDVEEQPSLAKKYKVRTMPTLFIFKNKEPLWRHSGMIEKAVLKAAINEYS
ncbi:thioredoxin family protein [Maribacter sp. ACAM166]|uniref:thioredoxin family protein n=1 Tax=Maribacter sp. ACAM166 TaxID=2508996 RepID=UPI0010FE7791|nr:thioredoxin family protein [Maribacter sp. ACAM166]TLP71134.1 thioredoxin family protein [Maribacter sp. ACAM166]